ncbi:MAG: aminotransferase class V-fold PLP-dependent enzyme [Polyangiales bacterium]
MTEDLSSRWSLDPAVSHLNHGSFGAAPTAVLDAQRALRDRMERNPMAFFVRDGERLLDEARAAVSDFVGCDADDLCAVPNATAAVNTVLRSLALSPGDELLALDHGYNACLNALRFVAEKAGARVVVVKVPFPGAGQGEVLEAVLRAVTSRTRLALLDHVTSPTALVLPVEILVRPLRERGVEVFIDGAHAPGMLPLNVSALGAGYYTGNLHKWVCAPKGAAFLHVRRDLQGGVRPLSISHGANATRSDRSRFRLEFDWTGTHDPTAFLAAPVAIREVGGMLPGGWEAVRRRNRATALRAREVLCDALGVEAPAPDSMIGTMAAVPLPASLTLPFDPCEPEMDPLAWRLLREHAIEVPVYPSPSGEGKLLRVSAQLYNRDAEYERLARALRSMM